MKQRIVAMAALLCLLILSCGFALAADGIGTYKSDFASITVTMVNQEPDPVAPGSVVDIRFKFENYGGKEATDIIAEIIPDFPFSPYAEGKSQAIGSLNAGQAGETGIIKKFRIRVSEGAAEGDNQLTLRYHVGDGPWVELDNFAITVRSDKALLAIESVKSGSESLEQGKKSIVTLTLHNKASSAINDVKIKLDLGGIPIAPLDSTNEKIVKHMAPDARQEVAFDLLAEPDAKADVYKIPVTITYDDEVGNGFSINNTMSLMVGQRPDLSVVLEESDISMAGQRGEVQIKFVNKGTTDIKFLNAHLEDMQGIEKLSVDEIYLGNVDSDDFETAAFTIATENSLSGTVMLQVRITYKDALNNDFEEEIEIPLRLYSNGEAKKLGLTKPNGTVGIVIVVVIVAGGIVAYRKLRKRKK